MVRTSWDDGHPLDFRIAELLTRYDLTGTFYIPRTNGPTEVMNEKSIFELSKRFNIGGHTLNHVVLNTHDEKLLQHEVHGSFHWLESIIGNAPSSFCFPKGVFNKTALKFVFDAGYKTARTTELWSTACEVDRVEPTTLQLYEHSWSTYAKHLIKRRRWNRLIENLVLHSTVDLQKLTQRLLKKMQQEGGCFHLWGHSWEIEEFGLWEKLKSVLSMLSEANSGSRTSSTT